MSEQSLLRTFVAVEIGVEAAARAAAIRERLERASGAADMKWVDPRNFHLTLKFLGPTRREDLPRLASALQEVAGSAVPFDLEFAGVGAFPNLQRPRVIWLGVAAGSDALAALAGRTEAACAELGWAREERPYRAHLTLARAREARRGVKSTGRAAAAPVGSPLLAALAAEREASAGTAAVHRLVLMESQLQPHGPTYSILHACPLGER